MVSRLAADSSTYVVNPNVWTCSCSFNTTSSLPCRHVLLVARRHVNLDSFPADHIHTRWRVRDTADILPRLRLWRAEIQSLRTALLLADGAFTHLIGEGFFEDDSDSTPRRPRRIAYFQLHRGEESDDVVLNNLEKRGVLMAEFSGLAKFLIRQSTPKFIDLVHDLHEVLRDLLLRWKGRTRPGTATEGRTPVDSTDDTISETASLCEDDDDEGADEPPVDLDEALSTLMGAAEISHHRKAKSMNRERGGGWTKGTDLIKSHAIASTQQTDVVLSDKESDSVGVIAPGAITVPITTPALAVPVPIATVLEPAILTNTKATGAPGTDASSCVGLSHFPFPELELGPLDDASSVATADISELVHPVAQHAAKSDCIGSPIEDANSTTSSFKPPSNISAVMDAVARFNMGQPSTEPQRPQNPLKRPKAATTAARRTFTLSDIFNSDSDCDNEHEDRDALEKSISVCTVSLPLADGTYKKQKTSGKATGVRLGCLVQVSDCAVSLRAYVDGLQQMRGIDSIPELWNKFPRLLTAGNFERRDVHASLERVYRPSLHLNFAVPEERVLDLASAISTAKQIAAAQGVIPSTAMVDLASPRASTWSREYVARFVGATEVRGFSEENVADLKESYKLPLSHTSYCADLNWLRADRAATLPRIPYAAALLLARGPVEDEDVSWGARDSIRAVLASCSLSTRFTVRTHNHIYVTVSDVLGHLARSARLNDSVLIYALKQMATDYGDVYVCDSLETRPSLPDVSPKAVRCLLFPINYLNQHWCIIAAMLDDGIIVDVAMYDPIQGPYHTNLAGSWSNTCFPMIRRWYERFELATPSQPRTRFVSITTQHDGSSCGIYCFAIAYDFAHGSRHFQAAGFVGESASCQLRVRLMWRIFCDSHRADNEEREREAVEMIERFETSSMLRLPEPRTTGKRKLRASLRNKVKQKDMGSDSE
jgi:hypothetical protein